jgi:hypothetical protein
MRHRWILLVVVLLAGAPALADHKFGHQVRFAGIHPIPKSEGGGICYIEGPHVHIYAANKLEYRTHGDDHVFVGDPVAYGYDGPKYAYKGPHPIHVEAVVGGDPDVEYCYIEGPHFHEFEPADNDDYTRLGNAYFYVGTPPPVMIEARPQYIGINAYYKPMVYTRPVVEVDAPPGWIGARAEFVTPAVVVDTPGAVVVDHRDEVIAPGVGIEAGVHVAVPMPSIAVGVGVNVGGPAVIVHDRPVIIEKHDNGRHEGWHKGKHR